LKESETINKKVDEACGKLDRMLDGLNQNLMATNRGNQLLEMILVHLESKGDVKQMSTFLHQRVAEGLDLPTITKAVDNNDERKQGTRSANSDSISADMLTTSDPRRGSRFTS
jgi:ATP-dependent RNA circularization protein (DNA/RNA ligase family)